jgi:hypothetical protein
MPAIVLTEPFIRHYEGSVFIVSDAIGVFGWDDDDRVRDRQPCNDNRFYNLPDNGKGVATELPLDYTFICPEKILTSSDIKSGPCRITSVSKSLEKSINDPYFVSPLPLGKGKILYMDSEKYMKNILIFELNDEELPDTVVIRNRINSEIKTLNLFPGKSALLSFDDFDPGFYEIDLLKSNLRVHYLTLIKCFPLMVKTSGFGSNYQISKTIW